MPRALVVTVVHHPEDARIRHRQIGALLGAGWQVTYAAPWAGHGVTPPTDVPGLRPLPVERARGRRRLGALTSARSLLRREGPHHDVVLLHDPELLLAVPGLRLPPVVWDVHEDTAAAVEVRAWVPDPVRRPLAGAVRVLERIAERRHPLLLADDDYAARFRLHHPVVPNTTLVPAHAQPCAVPGPDGALRVVYLGSVTLERGAREMATLGRELATGGGPAIRLEVIGPAHGAAARVLEDAAAAGHLRWHGFVPSDRALTMLDGALAGLSLLHDCANFRPSMPTKVVEYLAHGVPAVTTPLPAAERLVRASGGGVVVPFGDVDRALAQLRVWADDPAEARRVGAAGHATALAHHDWATHAPRFVEALTRAATGQPTATATIDD